MPIYVEYKKKPEEEFEVLGIKHNINGKDFKYIMELRSIIKKAKLSFIYKSDENFCFSIVEAKGYNTNIANFDISRCRGLIDEARYMSMMRELITQCNAELCKSNKLQFKESRFDIFGSWTRGEIVLLVPKNKRGWK